jgi:hypothetical protein
LVQVRLQVGQMWSAQGPPLEQSAAIIAVMMFW